MKDLNRLSGNLDKVIFAWLGFILFALFIFSQTALASNQQTGKLNSIASPAKILVWGDSLSAAFGMQPQQGWVALLQQKLQKEFPKQSIEVINGSVSGETTSGGLQRLPAQLVKTKPNLLILELGANDALRGQNLMQSKANLQKMMDMCRTQQTPCQTLLLGIRIPLNYGPAYERLLMKIYQDLADKNKISFDPFFLQTVAMEPDLMQADALHPNAQAQPQILQRVWPLINEYFQ